jgi:MSHA biogenesis protein MshO
MKNRQVATGFTLIELILVIVVLGILAVSVTSYIGLGARMYAETADRDQLLSQSRFAIERLVRELRNVVPNSVRVSGSCIEFMPLVNAGRYASIPTAAQSGTEIQAFSASPATNWAVQPGDYLAVYPTQTAHIYNPGLNRTVVVTNVLNNWPVLTFQFASNSFPTGSPSQRFYLMRTPVSYCVVNNQLLRYSGYVLQAGQPQPADLSNGVLMAEGLNQGGVAPFVFENGVLSRNSVVHLFLSFSSNFNDQLFFNQEVHIPNVP